MMDWSAHNAGYVMAAYFISAVGLIAIAIGIVLRDRKMAKAIAAQKD
jgi:heme exporter protein D